MSDFFKAYKRYIIHHQQKAQYKPTADKAFIRMMISILTILRAICKEIQLKRYSGKGFICVICH